MKQTKEIKNFIYSQYFSDGLRISAGVLLPSLLLAQLGHLEAGLAVSMGAITTSIPDNPGAVIHKRNGMLFCILFTIITSLLTGFINDYPILLGFEIFALCFFFSMFNIYGNRASSIGTAVLIVMIINIDRDFTTPELLKYTGLLVAGGIWYMALSLAVSQFRPFRIVQRTLGECISEVAGYLKIKAGFYNTTADEDASESQLDETYKKLIDQQIIVHQHQENVRDVLFRNKMFIKDPTNTGRLLVLVFLDIIDLFEQTMATHYDYRSIRNEYGTTGTLAEFQKILIAIADELENLGFDISANERPRMVHDLQAKLEDLKTRIDQTSNNFVLKKILINIRNIVNRINTIYTYFDHKKLKSISISNEKDLGRFVSAQTPDPKLFVQNISFRSANFRHALRVAIVAVVGYLVSKLFPLGHHSYWILLTIIVLLKPAFSLTRQRNYQRVIGTFAGGIAGALIVYYVHDHTLRLIFLMICMLGAYSFQRLNYVVSVLFMTPYVLIMFSFIGMGDLSLVKERIIDTFIGSFIAFTASYLLFPSWEYPQLKNYMYQLLISNYNYLVKMAEGLTGVPLDITEYKLVRKDVYVSSANMASAFQRMLSEPKNKQKNVREANKFMVLNHVLSSYIATLISAIRNDSNNTAHISQAHIKLIRRALFQLSEAISLLQSEDESFGEAHLQITRSNSGSSIEGTESKLITEQLEFINKTAGDLLKTAQRFTVE